MEVTAALSHSGDSLMVMFFMARPLYRGAASGFSMRTEMLFVSLNSLLSEWSTTSRTGLFSRAAISRAKPLWLHRSGRCVMDLLSISRRTSMNSG